MNYYCECCGRTGPEEAFHEPGVLDCCLRCAYEEVDYGLIRADGDIRDLKASESALKARCLDLEATLVTAGIKLPQSHIPGGRSWKESDQRCPHALYGCCPACLDRLMEMNSRRAIMDGIRHNAACNTIRQLRKERKHVPTRL